MWALAIGTFAVALLSGLAAELFREKERDPRRTRWNAERDPYFNRDYARPEKKRSQRAAAV
jgi:hypothetical protein